MVIQISYKDIFIDEGYISKEMCKQDEREFLSDFDICNKGESIGNRDKNCTIFINVLPIIDLMVTFLYRFN